jgi:hypothetical protein
MTEDGGDRLSRWSRLKLAAQTPEAEADLMQVAELEPAPAPAPEIVEGEIPEAELLEKLGLPDPDTMAAGDDFSAFMSKSVPDFLRKRALRRLWLSNPLLANVDGLVDYGDDFTDAATVPDVLNTIYKVGQGMVSRIEKALDELAGDDPVADAAASSPEAEEDASGDTGSQVDPLDAAKMIDPPDEITGIEPPAAMLELPQRPRRMRFEAG